MTAPTAHVVSDAFFRFAANPGAVQFTDAIEALEAMTAGRPVHGCLGDPEIRLRPGQGLNEAEVAALVDRARAAGIAERLEGFGPKDRPLKAPPRLTHKTRPENILISWPRKLADDLYESDLMLDSDSELMRDHVTGQHIQGMVLIEAARQTFLAVTEAHYMPADMSGAHYFVIESMAAHYKGFVFPVDATIRYAVDRADMEPGRLSFDVSMTVHQGGQSRAELPTSFTAYDKSMLVPKEERRAQRTLETLGAPREA
ncbi:MAG: AfsA-related hotdog domain-containing protein [Azospirillaceae bacterium]